MYKNKCVVTKWGVYQECKVNILNSTTNIYNKKGKNFTIVYISYRIWQADSKIYMEMPRVFDIYGIILDKEQSWKIILVPDSLQSYTKQCNAGLVWG